MADLEVSDQIKNIISSQFGIPEDNIEEESFLDEDLGITDLEMEDLAAQLESKFDIEIPQDKFSSFKKVSDLVNYVYESLETAL